jgi:hypothetical protein
MTNYSAAQAISPAIERTKQYLFQPFRWGRFLKLTLVALLTEGGMSSCNFNSHIPGGDAGPGSPLHMPIPMPHMHWPAMLGLAAMVAIFAIVVIPIWILISYLVIRLRFSFFDCVLNEQDRIAPAWRRYHRQTMRYLGLSLCIGLVFGVVIGVAGYNIYMRFRPLFESLRSGVHPTFSDFLPLIAVVAPLALLLALVAALVNIALRYFVLPRMALDDASIPEAVSEVWRDVVAEPGQFVLFILLRFLVTLVASIIGVIGLAIALVIVALIGAVFVLLLKAASTTVAVLLGVPAGILLLGVLMLAFIGVTGTIGTFRRNYAILFYAGRYPELALMLWPPPPPLPPWQPGYTSGPAQGA